MPVFAVGDDDELTMPLLMVGKIFLCWRRSIVVSMICVMAGPVAMATIQLNDAIMLISA